MVLARFVRSQRIAGPLKWQAFCLLRVSPGARAYCDQLRARGTGHQAALRQLSNRLVGDPARLPQPATCYDVHTAWATTNPKDQQAAS